MLVSDPDPNYPVAPIWLLLVVASMACAFGLRKWYYRIKHNSHQGWAAYCLVGCLAWVGLIKAHLHPALALVFVVPFMPGPSQDALENFESEVDNTFQELLADDEEEGFTQAPTTGAMRGVRVPTTADVLKGGAFNQTRGLTLQAGKFAGLAGKGVLGGLKVAEMDEEGNVTMQTSTLDSFEVFWTPIVDFSLVLFTMSSAGVELDKCGSMTVLILISLVIGKTFGIIGSYLLADYMGFHPPLGVSLRHVLMIGPIASIGLVVALFMSELAFSDSDLQAQSKIASLLSGLMGLVCWGVSLLVNFKEENIVETAMQQVEQKKAASVKKQEKEIKRQMTKDMKHVMQQVTIG